MVHAAEVVEDDPILLHFSDLRHLLRVTAWCLRWPRTLRSRRGSSVLGPLTLDTLDLTRSRRLNRNESVRCTLPGSQSSGGQCCRARRYRDTAGSSTSIHSWTSTDSFASAATFNIKPGRKTFRHIASPFETDDPHGGYLSPTHVARWRAAHSECCVFWIPGRRMTVKQRVRRCVTCARWRATSPNPMMGDLPRPRVSVSRPFAFTGVDYAGPIL